MQTHVVVDASVAAKWFILEQDSDLALHVLGRFEHQMLAPELMLAELGSVFLRRLTRGDITRPACLQAFAALEVMPVVVEPLRDLTEQARHIAMQTSSSFYDSLYLALAMKLDVPLITADTRFRNSLRHSPFANRVLDMQQATQH